MRSFWRKRSRRSARIAIKAQFFMYTFHSLKKLIIQTKYFFGYILRRGWATSLVGGLHKGRRSPSRDGLLDESSSISLTTTIVRAALIGKAKKKRSTRPQMPCSSPKKSKKRSTHPQMSCFPPKISVKQWRSKKFWKGCHYFHNFFNCPFIRQKYFEADWEARKALGGSGGHAPWEKILKIYML